MVVLNMAYMVNYHPSLGIFLGVFPCLAQYVGDLGFQEKLEI